MRAEPRLGRRADRLPAILVFTGAAAVGLALIVITGEAARSGPMKTIRIVDPNQVGGPVDRVARLLGEEIGRTQGLTFVIENRPGAGTLIGTEAVSRSPSDGATLLMNGNPFLINPHLRKAHYDPLTSFDPICRLATAPNVIAVNSASPYRSLADLLDAARAKPGELTLASIGPGTATQIAFEKFKRDAKIDMTFVPFAGTAPAVSALLGQHVTSYLGNTVVVAEHLKAGTLRALAVAGRTRIDALPALPTTAELGYAEFTVDYWIGVFAPANTPKETISRLGRWFTTAMQAPEIKADLAIRGLVPAVLCGTDFVASLRTQYDDYGRIIRQANIRAE